MCKFRGLTLFLMGSSAAGSCNLMGSSVADSSSEDPLTAVGRIFLQPQMHQIIHCAMGFENPIDIEAIKSHLTTSLLASHPRFSSLLVRDSQGRQRWHKIPHVDLDRHIIVLQNPITTSTVDHETAVNEYMAQLSTAGCALSTDKPLWELHLLMAHNCGVFRIQHALADGVSLMSSLVASFRTLSAEDEEKKISTLGFRKKNKGNGENGWWSLVIGFVGMLWFSLVFVLDYVLRCFWVSDRNTAISGGDGVEVWPRKLATARFRLEDMKLLKKAVPNATINDVLVGVVSSGLSRYLDHQTPNALPEGTRITGTSMVNLREQPRLQVADLMNCNSESSWGNKFSMTLLPIYYHKGSGTDPLVYLKRAKVMNDRKKQSLEAPYIYKIGCFLITYFGAKALTMHFVSYGDIADMQILVAKDIIPDPEFLAKCFEEALLAMKEAAATLRH